MKLEELLAPCPKCGSKDKIAHRKMLDNHRAHAEMDVVKCEDCGYKFEVQEEVSEMEPIEIIPQEDGTVLANYIPIVKELE